VGISIEYITLAALLPPLFGTTGLVA